MFLKALKSIASLFGFGPHNGFVPPSPAPPVDDVEMEEVPFDDGPDRAAALRMKAQCENVCDEVQRTNDLALDSVRKLRAARKAGR